MYHLTNARYLNHALSVDTSTVSRREKSEIRGIVPEDALIFQSHPTITKARPSRAQTRYFLTPFLTGIPGLSPERQRSGGLMMNGLLDIHQKHTVGRATTGILEIDEPVPLLQPVEADACPCGALISDEATVFDPEPTVED